MSRPARAESSTPARNTRARSQTPLPGLATKQSHAYGAQGKTNLHTQIRASGSTAGSTFAEEFSAAQTPAKAAGVRQRPRRQQTSAPFIPPQPAPVIEEEDDDVDEEDEEDEESEENVSVAMDQTADTGRLQTGLGQGMGYGNDAAVHAIPEPSAWRNIRRRMRGFNRALVLEVLPTILCLALLYAWLPLTGDADLKRFKIFWRVGVVLGLPGYAGPPLWALEMWTKTMVQNLTAEMVPDHNVPEIQWGINMNMLTRLGTAEVKQNELRSILGLQNETLEYVKSILPMTIVLDESEGEQRYVIPQQFWQALSERIAEGGDEAAPMWDSFIANNEKQIQDLSWRAADSIVSEAAHNGQLITKDAFARALDQQNLDLAERYTQDYRRMWEQNFETVRSVAQSVTEETMEKFSTVAMVRQQLEVLSKAVDLHNTYDSLRTYNWFTFGEGAFIDPHLTSATKQPKAYGWFKDLWHQHGPITHTQNPPSTVLLPWTEVTDCWCAARSSDGSTQVSMIMLEAFHPEKLIIEHIPAGGTRRIANAPRTLEVWADVGSAAEATRLGEVMEETIPYPSQKACSERPSDRHVCIARGEYDIHHYNHVQSLSIWTDTKSIGLTANSFTVRVVENWGGERTCLYRLRMIGEAVDEDEGATTIAP